MQLDNASRDQNRHIFKNKMPVRHLAFRKMAIRPITSLWIDKYA